MITSIRKSVLAILVLAGMGLMAAGLCGCDDYVAAGDFYSPTVEPADFSPYGYDYSMYDLFTQDL